ncbi:hypothetical protein ACH5RR_013235 [Cinchona calisaya]|uniref:Uncharacterized protein n=1 Tax=Cinchona calisaya TaxID=153742 RepID=A0ABD2ZZY7_9GENT
MFLYAKKYIRKLAPSISGAGANADNGRASVGQFEAANVAKKCLLAAVKANTRAAHLWSNLANAYFSMGEHRIASKCLEKEELATRELSRRELVADKLGALLGKQVF